MSQPVHSLSSVMQILRRQLSAKAERRSTLRTDATNARGGASAAATSLKGKHTERFGALNPTDPLYSKKARRTFLYLVLAEEFGEAAANEPAFALLVEQVEAAMDYDEQINAAFAELFRRLIND